MNSSYQNGHMYGFDSPFHFDPSLKMPYVSVEMSAGLTPGFQRVIGKMDTGATRSMLSFNTANVLGMSNPREGCIDDGICSTATSEQVPFYIHSVTVRVRNAQGSSFQFELRPGFAEGITSDLFGMDWTLNICIAIDWQTVHLLRD